ncbi:MAG: Lrp/AsnC family transcriptional regulator [Nanoarchaeota archaeon]|nr:Lrp/AsnC family transcriptional regulator [Nanoarchaeota archaeon]
MVEKLDLKDRKILSQLDLNARLPISTIAKNIGLSRQVTEYRIKRLEDKKIITGYIPIYNYPTLGYRNLRVRVNLQNPNMENERNLINFCKNHNKFYFIAKYEGPWDYSIGFLVKNIDEEEECLNDLQEAFGENIYTKFVSYPAYVTHLSKKFLAPNARGITDSITVRNYPVVKINRIEEQVLESLFGDGKKTIVDISRKYSIHPKKTRSIIDSFLEKNIILGFKTQMNLSELGYTHYKVLINYVKYSESAERKMINYLSMQPGIMYVIKPIGQYDFEFEMAVKTNENIHAVLQEYKNKFFNIIKNIHVYTTSRIIGLMD